MGVLVFFNEQLPPQRRNLKDTTESWTTDRRTTDKKKTPKRVGWWVPYLVDPIGREPARRRA